MKAYAVWVKSYNNGLWDEYLTESIYIKKEKAEIYANRVNERFHKFDIEHFVMEIEIVE